MLPTIHLVKTRLVNTYVVEYPDRLLVVDVAYKYHRVVLGFIEDELKREISDVAWVTCSHDDPDHIGGVQDLAELCDACIAIPFAAHAPIRKFLHDPYGPLHRLKTSIRELFRLRAWAMYFNPFRDNSSHHQTRYQGDKTSLDESSDSSNSTTRFRADVRLTHRQLFPDFDDWQVIHTPGHSWDSCCFFHAGTQSLLSGDTLLGSGKQNRLVVPAIYSNRRHMERTLTTLQMLDIQTVYPGHGSQMSGNSVLAQVVVE
ncbi:MAG: MBL fold metallo-hydrolase [Pseudomonadota bacterium]